MIPDSRDRLYLCKTMLFLSVSRKELEYSFSSSDVASISSSEVKSTSWSSSDSSEVTSISSPLPSSPGAFLLSSSSFSPLTLPCVEGASLKEGAWRSNVIEGNVTKYYMKDE